MWRRWPGSQARSGWTPTRPPQSFPRDRFAEEVRRDEEQARALGISGVPFFRGGPRLRGLRRPAG